MTLTRCLVICYFYMLYIGDMCFAQFKSGCLHSWTAVGKNTKLDTGCDPCCVWLGLGPKTPWLGLKKCRASADLLLSPQTRLEMSADVSDKVSSGSI